MPSSPSSERRRATSPTSSCRRRWLPGAWALRDRNELPRFRTNGRVGAGVRIPARAGRGRIDRPWRARMVALAHTSSNDTRASRVHLARPRRYDQPARRCRGDIRLDDVRAFLRALPDDRHPARRDRVRLLDRGRSTRAARRVPISQYAAGQGVAVSLGAHLEDLDLSQSVADRTLGSPRARIDTSGLHDVLLLQTVGSPPHRAMIQSVWNVSVTSAALLGDDPPPIDGASRHANRSSRRHLHAGRPPRRTAASGRDHRHAPDIREWPRGRRRSGIRAHRALRPNASGPHLSSASVGRLARAASDSPHLAGATIRLPLPHNNGRPTRRHGLGPFESAGWRVDCTTPPQEQTRTAPSHRGETSLDRHADRRPTVPLPDGGVGAARAHIRLATPAAQGSPSACR